MTKEYLQQKIDILQAYIDGKTIETLDGCGQWVEAKEKDIKIRLFTAMLRIKEELNKHCIWCIDKGCNCGNCSDKDEENSYYLLHKEKFPEQCEKNCKNCVGEWEWNGKKAYCKYQNSNRSFICDSYKRKKEKHYRPFEDTTELMLHYKKHFNIDFPPFYEPIIWVKNKHDDKRFLIIGYDELTVDIGISKFTMKDLFRQCVFLDSSPIGQVE